MFYLYEMKQWFLVCLLPIWMNSQNASKRIRVLFIGNSYTYVNNLPQLIAQVAHAQGDSVFYDSYCPGGYTFSNHFYDLTTKAKISAGNWDYVVLQAQSQEPAFSPAQVNSQTLPFAIKLDSMIAQYNPCANTVFYETWGRKYGDVANCPFYPPICTYTGMQNRLKQSYKLFADTVHDLMAPVGEAFRKVISTNSLINLYQPDDSHPSLEGTYLAASVFYETLFQRSVLSNTYNPGINASTLTILNQAAHQTVVDSLVAWNISKYVPKSHFNAQPQSTTSFSFTADPHPFVNKWFFGDGSFSFALNPTHTYSNSGTFTVSLLVYDFNSCKKDSSSMTVNVANTTQMNELTQEAELLIFPNPCSNTLYLNHALIKNSTAVQIADAMGHIIHQGIHETEIPVLNWLTGVYTLTVYTKESCQHFKFFKID